MPWFKVDDKLHDHRKARHAGKAAMGVWAMAGSWCMDNLTDGFVPETVLSRWGNRRDAAKLVTANLWSTAERNGEKGWQFHAWDEYQPSKAEIEAERKAARERLRKWRNKRRGNAVSNEGSNAVTHGVTHAVSNTVSNAAPTRPDPTRPLVPNGTSDGPRKRAHQIPNDWKPSDKHQDLAAELGVSLDVEVQQFRDHHTAKGSTFKDWDAALRTWLRNAAKFGGGRAIPFPNSTQPRQAGADPGNEWMRRRPEDAYGPRPDESDQEWLQRLEREKA